MMIDGRKLIADAVQELNAAKVLKFDVAVPTIDTANGPELEEIVNYFLDSVESIPENKESTLPKSVISAYNSIVDKVVTFNLSEAEVFNIDTVVYKRTKFHD